MYGKQFKSSLYNRDTSLLNMDATYFNDFALVVSYKKNYITFVKILGLHSWITALNYINLSQCALSRQYSHLNIARQI